MIERHGGKIIIECDSCPETFDSEETEFAVAWSEAKSKGWRTKRIGKDWVHGCPRCGT